MLNASFILNNRLEEIATLAERIDAFGEAAGVPPEILFKLNLVIDELVTNIISYGYEDALPHVIEVSLTLDGDRLTAKLRDDGNPFNPLEEAPDPDLHAPLEERAIGGLGLHFMRVFMDELAYRREADRNIMTLVKRIAIGDGD